MWYVEYAMRLGQHKLKIPGAASHDINSLTQPGHALGPSLRAASRCLTFYIGFGVADRLG